MLRGKQSQNISHQSSIVKELLILSRHFNQALSLNNPNNLLAAMCQTVWRLYHRKKVSALICWTNIRYLDLKTVRQPLPSEKTLGEPNTT